MKARSLLGMPVVNPARGRIIGRVRDLLIEDFELKGLLIEEENNKAWLVERKDFSIGEDAVLVNENGGLKPCQEREKSSYKEGLRETVFDESGREIGRVSDLVIDEEAKATVGIEISGGVIGDFLAGKRPEVSLDSVIVNGSDVVVVESKEGG